MPTQAWQRNTPRKDRSSQAWKQARKAALTRDNHQCRAVVHGVRCTHRAQEVDHITQGDDHSLANLASLCIEHHKQKTQQEATTARWKHREKRTPEKHPGLITKPPATEGTWG